MSIYDQYTARDLLDIVIQKDTASFAFQPIISNYPEEEYPAYWEALTRIEHIDEESINIEEFVMYLEAHNEVIRFDLSRLDSLIKTIPMFSDHTTITWNASGFTVSNDSAVNHTITAITRAKIQDRIIIEITETALDRDKKILQENVMRLAQNDIQSFMDDFGQGWANIESLQGIPYRGMKISRPLFLTSLTSNVATEMVKGIINFSRDKDMIVVIEGIEDMEQLKAAIALGPTHCQGYLFSKPKNLGEIRTDELIAKCRDFFSPGHSPIHHVPGPPLATTGSKAISLSPQ
ncbi:MAG: EAL domain-containing protein [Pseudomonadales bacterium]